MGMMLATVALTGAVRRQGSLALRALTEATVGTESGWGEGREKPSTCYIVTGGGLSEEGGRKSSREDFLVPVRALSVIFRAKFRDLLKKTELFDLVDTRVIR